MKSCPRSHCPIAFALDMFGDSWTLLLLRDLILKGKRRFQEFLASEEGISTNILADRLAKLERNGLVTRQPDPDNKKQILYAPTAKGLDLIPVMLEMIRWSAKHDPETAAPKAFVKRLKADREGLVAAVRQGARS